MMGKSVEIMKVMNSLISIPELSATMQAMAREMEKAGLCDEIVGEAFDALDVSPPPPFIFGFCLFLCFV